MSFPKPFFSYKKSLNTDSKYRLTIFVVFCFIAILILLSLNIYFLSNKNVSFQEVITVLLFNKMKRNQDIVNDNLNIAPIQRSIWICFSSIVAAVVLVISGAFIQSLTQNPLADPTTLGFTTSSIFGIMIMKGVASNIVEASNYHIYYFLFALFGGLLTLVILAFLFKKPFNKQQQLKIILIGLVLNMIFKTLSYLVKEYSVNAVTPAFKLALGGAENVYNLYSNQFSFLKWCAVGTVIIFLLSFFCSQKLNLVELGEEQATTLGVNVKLFKYFGYTTVLISGVIAIVLAGNVTFLGLICTHAVRSFFKTKRYQIIIPMACLLAIVIFMVGLFIHSIVPFISSSISILFLGGCVLFYLTMKEKNS